MSKNNNLLKAKKEANDEFYTQYEDIAKEIEHYKEHLKGKVVYCNCDIPHFSNFHKYFLDNFKELELKQLIVTGYVKNGNGKCSIYDGEKSTDYDLLGDGDFRGDECIDMLQKADVVITNPPFSLFREFIKVVLENGKGFIVVGSKTSIGYKDIFKLFQSGVISTGYEIPKKFFSSNGEITSIVKDLCRWFTSLPVTKPLLSMGASYYENNYTKYDNYNAINIDRVCDIPHNYEHVMGVPITFMDKYNQSQFEIVRFRKGDDGKDLRVDGKDKFHRVLIKRKGVV